MDLQARLSSVEKQLNLLLEDLGRIVNDSQDGSSASSVNEWATALEDFRIKATTIRRILDRFQHADLATRRYLRRHLDEEFAQLKGSYDSLREQFTAQDEALERQQGG